MEHLGLCRLQDPSVDFMCRGAPVKAAQAAKVGFGACGIRGSRVEYRALGIESRVF